MNTEDAPGERAENVDEDYARHDREIASLKARINRLEGLNAELMAWIKKRKNKLHPGDPIHEILNRMEIEQ